MSGVTFNVRTRQYLAPTETPTATRCTAFSFPDDPVIRSAILDCMAYLAQEGVWIPSENVSEIDMRAMIAKMLYDEGTGC